jgi:hypothetical protein
MPANLLPLAYSLIGALLAIAATWGRNGETIRQLRDAVDKLTSKIEQLAALEKADALHTKEFEHVRETLRSHEERIRALEDITRATPLPGARTIR